MKRRLSKFFLIVTAIFLFLYLATWFYYHQKGVPKQHFISSIIPVSKSFQVEWVPIHWQTNEFSDRAAMYIPVNIDTIHKAFWMQFDLGTPVTDMLDISAAFSFLKKHREKNNIAYTDLKLKTGNNLYYGKNIPVISQTPDSLMENDSMYNNKIGDAGYDLIKDRILIIDYRESRMAIVDSLSQEYEKNSKWFADVFINQMPVFLPIKINSQKKYMQFDNGSSAFTMWMQPDQWNSWRNQKEKVDTFIGYSWGRKEYYFRAAPSVDINFLGSNFSNMPIWGVEKSVAKKKGVLQSIKIFTDKHFGKIFSGTIGNEYFRNEVVIFDTRSNRLGIYLKKE